MSEETTMMELCPQRVDQRTDGRVVRRIEDSDVIENGSLRGVITGSLAGTGLWLILIALVMRFI